MFSFKAYSIGDKGKFDILVNNRKIADGTGNPWFYGDVGITGDALWRLVTFQEKLLLKLSMLGDW